MKAGKPIKEIMTTRLVTILPSTKAIQVKRIFEKNSFHHLPVVDEDERLLGIISKEDLFKVSYILSLNTSGETYSSLSYRSITANELMTHYPLALDPDDTIGLAADIILANKFHALPIIEDGKLVGLVTSHDLLKYSFTSLTMEQEIH